MDLTIDQFAKACGAEVGVAADYFDHAVAAMARFRISETPVQVAAFLATVSVESRRLTAMEEDLYYKDARRVAELFKRVFDANHDRVITDDEVKIAMGYVRNPKGLSMRLYNGYHGRGPIQLTWERNYKLHGDKLGFNYVADPNLVKTPEHGFLVAASFWDEIDGNAISHDMGEVTLRVNGPKRLALGERIAQFQVAQSVLA